MKFSYQWLQSHIVEKLPEPKALSEQIIFHAFEVESVQEKTGDSILDVQILPDRARDCLSHHGLAREVAGLLNLHLKEKNIADISAPALALPIELKSDACRRYTAASMSSVSVGPSPTWLRDYLESVGQKSINNIVDAANFVMLDMGQPIHVFDLKKIDGGIVVRPAHEGETIIPLGAEDLSAQAGTKTLTPDMLVIADYVGAVAIAGIKGGKTAEIDSNTKDILIEVANFDPVSVRKTARALGLTTDASKRFENEYSAHHTMEALAQIVAIITEIAGGEIVGMVDQYPAPIKESVLTFTYGDISRLLGESITPEHLSEVFDQYKYSYKRSENTFTLTVPLDRSDIVSAYDIAEEVGRVIGYDTIPTNLPIITKAVVPNVVYENTRAARNFLIQKGFREVLTYTFRKNGDVFVVRGATDKSALRTNLTEGLKESYDFNSKNLPLLGITSRVDLKLFEIGTVFFKDKNATAPESFGIREEIRVAWIDLSGIQELPLAEFIEREGVDTATAIPYARIPTGTFRPWSLYPFSVRDIAVWIDRPVDKPRLVSIVENFGKKYCVTTPQLFDEFTKDGRTSLAFRLVFQGSDRTLTDPEISSWMDALIEELKSEKLFEIR